MYLLKNMDIELIYTKITSRDILTHIVNLYEEFYIQRLRNIYRRKFRKLVNDFNELNQIRIQHEQQIIDNNVLNRNDISIDYSRMNEKMLCLYFIYERQVQQYECMYYRLSINQAKYDYNTLLCESDINTIRMMIRDTYTRQQIVESMKEKLFHISNAKLNIHKCILYTIYEKTHSTKFVVKNLIGLTSGEEISIRKQLDMRRDKIDEYFDLQF